MLLVYPERGTTFYLIGLGLAVLISEVLLRGVRLRLPLLYRLPYHHAEMSCRRVADGVRYESARPGASFSGSYRGEGPLFQAEPGTLEYFLSNVRRDAILILQGQSASVHPKVLFEAGVHWVATTLKPPDLGRLAGPGHSGDDMRPLLQGGLPWIYLTPRRATSDGRKEGEA